jgi:hypothetical protein
MPWVLVDGAGEKTVYVEYLSVNGAVLGTANASIDLLGAGGGGGGGSGGNGGGGGTGTGQVLGASTSCGVYLNDYIKLGANNDPTQVEKLQTFLNQNIGANLPVTGFYGPATYAAVQKFQVKYHGSILAPWVPYGLQNEMTPTGYVYKTTKWWINTLECQSLGISQPALP